MALAKLSVLFCLLAFWAFEYAHGASPKVDCSSLVLNLADCLSYVSNGSTTTKPEGSCCSGLKTVIKTAPECLCEGFKSSASMGVVLNVTKAMALPAACKVSAPSAAKCGLSLSPNGAPAAAPDGGAMAPEAASPTSGGVMSPTSGGGVADATAPTMAAGPTAMTPASSPGSSSGSSRLASSMASLVFGLAVWASFSSF